MALKNAMLDSNVLQDGLNGFTGTTKQTADFQHWLVRQVEHRADLAMDNRPAPWEIDWHHWAEWLCKHIAMGRRVHVEAATVFLSNLPPELGDGSFTDSDMVGGKRRDRVEADRVHTGPVPRGSIRADVGGCFTFS